MLSGTVGAMETPYPVIEKPASFSPKPNLESYAEACERFTWEEAEACLDGLSGGGWNIAHEARRWRSPGCSGSGHLGVKSEEALAEDMWDWERVRLQEGEVMVVVDQYGHPDDVQRILKSHGGRLVAKPGHIALLRRRAVGDLDRP